MKLCIDCKYHSLVTNQFTLEPNQHACSVDGLINPVDGSPMFNDCYRMREGKCGMKGKLWEPKEPKPSS